MRVIFQIRYCVGSRFCMLYVCEPWIFADINGSIFITLKIRFLSRARRSLLDEAPLSPKCSTDILPFFFYRYFMDDRFFVVVVERTIEIVP